ncbi:MAG: recombinase family protein [Geobacter sp.]|nr:recombinase family protein [Geobacter sp.]
MSGQIIGYRRVSSEGQNLDRQLDGQQLDQVFEEKISGKDTNRPELQRMIEYARKGDTVVVHSLDRLGRSLLDLRKIVAELNDKGVAVRFLKEGMEFDAGSDDPFKALMLNMLGSFAEFERSLIKSRQAEGIKLAKQKGVYKGRSKCLKPEQAEEARARVAAGVPKSRVASDLGITRQTLYKYLEGVKA